MIHKQLAGLADFHLEDVRNRMPFINDLQGLAVESLAQTDRTLDPDICQKVHLELVRAIAGTCFAAAALNVETEPASGVSASLGFRQLAEKGSDLIP